MAYGCSSGIELQWVDAISGDNLSRWFPTSTSSDFLHFLPPRQGIDSAKNLRLVSSAAHPEERVGTHKYYFGQPRARASLGGFFSQPEFTTYANFYDDHYRAVPLSDGHHILFTDPATRMLSIGCDAFMGHTNRLSRKFVFLPPKGADLPRVYAVARDLS